MEQPRSSQPRKFLERRETAICRVALKVKFAILEELKLTVLKEFSAENPSKRLVTLILQKYRFKTAEESGSHLFS